MPHLLEESVVLSSWEIFYCPCGPKKFHVLAVVFSFLAVHSRCFYLTSICIVKNLHLNAPSEAYPGAESVRLG